MSRACRELPIRQIRSVLDWVSRDPQVFVASAVADSGRCITEAVADFVSGRLNSSTIHVHGLEDPDYVRLVMTPAYAEKFGSAISDWKMRLLSGEIRPDDSYEGPELDWKAT